MRKKCNKSKYKNSTRLGDEITYREAATKVMKDPGKQTQQLWCSSTADMQ